MAILFLMLLAITCMNSITFCDGKGGILNIAEEVKRTSISSLLNASSLGSGVSLKNQAPSRILHNYWTGNGAEFAGIVVQGDITSVQAKMTIYKPEGVETGEYSSMFVAVANGDDEIKVGWMVNPDIYKDTEVHLFTSYNGANHRTCVDTNCPDFIATNITYKPGDILNPSKVGSSTQNYLDIHIAKADLFGWWYVLVNSEGLGHWKQDYLSKGAARIRVGGEAYTSTWLSSSPPMGTGAYESGNRDTTCYFQDIKINLDDVDKGGYEPQDPQVIETRCYLVGDVGNRKLFDGFGFFVGGSGGEDHATCLYDKA